MNDVLYRDELEEQIAQGWRVSPLATAIRFSHEEDIEFHAAPHLKLISDAIVDAVNGDAPPYLIVNMPPRHGKSWLITRRTSEWFLANNPTAHVGVIGYGNDFAKDWGRIIRNDFKRHSDLVGFTLAEDSQAANKWHTSEGGMLWTAGIDGSILGRGADLMIIDDPVKSSKEAHSPTERDNLWRAYTGQIRSRIQGVVVVVMQRWDEDDFCARLLDPSKGGGPHLWRVLPLPALYDKVAAKDGPCPLGRQVGDMLWPEKWPEEKLRLAMASSDEDWESMYQQRPPSHADQGAVYYAFEPNVNVRQHLDYDDRYALCWSLDFNVDPFCSVIAQIIETAPMNHYFGREVVKEVRVLQEIIQRNSRTSGHCDEFIRRCHTYFKRNGRLPRVKIFGDASGAQRNTAAQSTDWEIVKEKLRLAGIEFEWFVRKGNGSVRDRTNTVNAALRSAAGRNSLFIDSRCAWVIKDLKNVRWRRDSNNNPTSELDTKEQDRTHVSDALSYMTLFHFGLFGQTGEMSGSIG